MKKNAKKTTPSRETRTPSGGPQPMDASVVEHRSGTPTSNAPRVCYAIKTLVAEVHSLFPETTVEYGDYDGRNTALSVTFDLESLSANDRAIFTALLQALPLDTRVQDVQVTGASVLVRAKSSPRTQDSREPFSLADAYLILSEDDDDDEGWTFEDDRPAPDFALGGSL